jgi:hypothetical protein
MRWGRSGESDAARGAAGGAAGEIIRRLHWRAWREASDVTSPAPDVSVAEILSVLPVLVESGSVGLVWPRLRSRFPVEGAVGAALEGAFRSQEAHNAAVARELGRVVGRLREHHVAPVLIKGLAVARLYPAGHPTVPVRPAGDIDLVVRYRDYETAKRVLGDVPLSFHGDRSADSHARREPIPSHRSINVDLHGFSNWYGRPMSGFFEHAETVCIGGSEILVPRLEDHLRALCLHFLWHGGARPLRLCDIALILDALPGALSDALPGALQEPEGRELDWDRCLAGASAEREQIMVAVRLAADLLGARIAGEPNEVRDYALPLWVTTTVLERWGWGHRPVPHRDDLLRGPVAAYGLLASRWLDPISATVRVGGRFDDGPRWRNQMSAFAMHIGANAGVVLPRVGERTVRRR